MSMVAWDDAYSVEIQEIDEQHKCLIEIMNELYTAMANKSNRDLISDVLDKLVDYTKVHFAVEETLMRVFHYEGPGPPDRFALTDARSIPACCSADGIEPVGKR